MNTVFSFCNPLKENGGKKQEIMVALFCRHISNNCFSVHDLKTEGSLRIVIRRKIHILHAHSICEIHDLQVQLFAVVLK